jgi:hypothetical protein
MLGPFLRPKPLLLRRPASLHLALHRLRPFRARRSLHRRQRADGLLVPLGQRAALGYLLRVLDGGQPRRALGSELPPDDRLSPAAVAPMSALAFLRLRRRFGDHRKLVNERLAETPAQQLGVKTRKCTLCPSRANEHATSPLPVRFMALGCSQRLYRAQLFKGSALVAASRKCGP